MGNESLRSCSKTEAATSEPNKLDTRTYADRQDYQREYQRGWVKSRRQKWIDANGPCKACGSSENLEVDHVDPIRKVSHRIWSWTAERREKELRKCQVLCRPCHRKKTVAFNARIKVAKPGPTRTLSDAAVLTIYQRVKAGESVRALGREYNISHSSIADIRDGRTFAWLTQPKTKPEQLSLGVDSLPSIEDADRDGGAA